MPATINHQTRPQLYSMTHAETRRWAFYNIGARMCSFDTGRTHGPALLAYDNAPRAITQSEAETIAAAEYSSRGCMMLSRGADGGMHFRGDAYSPAAALGWSQEKARALVRKIMAGEARFTVFYDRARDTFYCG